MFKMTKMCRFKLTKQIFKGVDKKLFFFKYPLWHEFQGLFLYMEKQKKN